MDDRIKETKPDPEEQKRDERLCEFFKKIAGEDMEVDWIELKQILDYALKNGMQCFYSSLVRVVVYLLVPWYFACLACTRCLDTDVTSETTFFRPGLRMLQCVSSNTLHVIVLSRVKC